MAKRYNTPDAAGVLHFVTLSVRDKRKAFSREQFADACLNELRNTCDQSPAKLIAYVATLQAFLRVSNRQ